MTAISKPELMQYSGGATQLECFFTGAIFAAALATGNILAAAGAGVYLAANCIN